MIQFSGVLSAFLWANTLAISRLGPVAPLDPAPFAAVSWRPPEDVFDQ
jgi:hypothetical protein